MSSDLESKARVILERYLESMAAKQGEDEISDTEALTVARIARELRSMGAGDSQSPGDRAIEEVAATFKKKMAKLEDQCESKG